jgi:hypothetical protein
MTVVFMRWLVIFRVVYLISAAQRNRLGGSKSTPGKFVTSKPALILIVFALVLGAGSSQAQSAKVIGSWSMEVTFGNGEGRSFRFEARESGKGSILLVDPRSKVWGPARPSEAKWTQSDDGSVMFSGPVEFLLGNVGRDPGTLVLKGKFGIEGMITGAAMFFPLDQDPKDSKARPSKSGTFKATRVAVDDRSKTPPP